MLRTRAPGAGSQRRTSSVVTIVVGAMFAAAVVFAQACSEEMPVREVDAGKSCTVDGKTYANGESTGSVCGAGCWCNDGFENCMQGGRPVCYYDGTSYPERASFVSRDGCSACYCAPAVAQSCEGVLKCRKVSCDASADGMSDGTVTTDADTDSGPDPDGGDAGAD